MTQPSRIVLTGFMGSGKSTVGVRLAGLLGYRFADLDSFVEAHAAQSIERIFAEQGETAFRQLELSALRSLLEQTSLVVALGGGAAETPAVRELLTRTPSTRVVYLEAPFATLWARCQLQALDPGSAVRPNLADPIAAEQRFARRLPLYEAMSHHRIACDAASADALAERIRTELLTPHQA